jgi:hypothetical protein
LLLAARNALEPRWFDHEVRYGQFIATPLDNAGVVKYLRSALDEPRRILKNFNKLFDQRMMTAAFGRPGEAGSPERLRHLTHRIVGCYEDLLNWGSPYSVSPSTASLREGD